MIALALTLFMQWCENVLSCCCDYKEMLQKCIASVPERLEMTGGYIH
jgi:hypothetical protein